LKGSDFRLDHPQKRVDHVDGVHFHFEDDKSQPPRKIKMPPIILEVNGDGTFTQWSFSLFGSVGHQGTLKPGNEVEQIRSAADRKAVEQIETMFAKAMQSQMSMFVAMGGKVGSGA
jgi:translation elongation factor EF-Tu-like GTPase